MKFKLSLKNKEVSMEADVEKLVEKGMDHKATRAPEKQDIKSNKKKIEKMPS